MKNENFNLIYGFDPVIEKNMLSAMKLYFLYGIPPGSCTQAIIDGDYDRAFRSSHSRVKEVFNQLYVTLRYILGEFVLEYDNWQGYQNLQEYEQAMLSLQSGDDTVGIWIQQYHDLSKYA